VVKKVVAKIKLQILPGKANPAPPVGPALGQRGINIMEFCKQFNDATKSKNPAMKLPVEITAYSDKTFEFTIKEPPTSLLIINAAGASTGAKAPGRDATTAKVKMTNIEEIAKIKMAEIGAYDIQSAKKVVCGTARSVGIEIVS